MSLSAHSWCRAWYSCIDMHWGMARLEKLQIGNPLETHFTIPNLTVFYKNKFFNVVASYYDNMGRNVYCILHAVTMNLLKCVFMRVALHALRLHDNALWFIFNATLQACKLQEAFWYSVPLRTSQFKLYVPLNTLRSFHHIFLLSTLCMLLLKFAWVFLCVLVVLVVAKVMMPVIIANGPRCWRDCLWLRVFVHPVMSGVCLWKLSSLRVAASYSVVGVSRDIVFKPLAAKIFLHRDARVVTIAHCGKCLPMMTVVPEEPGV